MFYQNELFAIEEKESKIAIMKANMMFESAMDNIIIMENSSDLQKIAQKAKDSIKKFIDDLIEMLKETARKVELKVSNKMEEIKFDILMTRLKKMVNSTDFKYTKASGTIDMLDIRKIQAEFEKGVSSVMKQIQSLKKCKTYEDFIKTSDMIDRSIDKLEQTVPVSKLDKYMIRVSSKTFVEKLNVTQLKSTPQAVVKKMQEELSELKSMSYSQQLKSVNAITMNKIPGVELVSQNQIVQKVQQYSSRIAHYASRYMISVGAWFAGTALENMSKINTNTGSDGIVNNTSLGHNLAKGISVGAASGVLSDTGRAMKTGALVNAVNTSRELANEVKGKAVPKKK